MLSTLCNSCVVKQVLVKFGSKPGVDDQDKLYDKTISETITANTPVVYTLSYTTNCKQQIHPITSMRFVISFECKTQGNEIKKNMKRSIETAEHIAI